MKIHFYKAIRPGVAGVYSHGVRIVTKSIYSHCEIEFSDGMSWSSSYSDGGVRRKKIIYDPTHWDTIELPDHLFAANALKWFEDHEGAKYDLLGNVHFLLSVIGDNSNKWFCSEAIGTALGIPDAWRLDPGTLYQVVKWMAENLSTLQVIT